MSGLLEIAALCRVSYSTGDAEDHGKRTSEEFPFQLATGRAYPSIWIWHDYITEQKAERTRPYEIVGYVVKGEITVIIDGRPSELVEGDSFVIPPNTSHSYSIPMPATVIEATAPPASQELS